MKFGLNLIVICVFSFSNINAGQLNKCVFTQLKYEGKWDPYPEVWQDIMEFVNTNTSVKSENERRVITLDDKLLFSSPFIIILGSGKFPELSLIQREIVRRYLSNGGLIFAEDSSGIRDSSFNESFRKELSMIFPEIKMQKLMYEHPIFKAYYLLRKTGGRRLINNYLEGLDKGGRTVVIYSQNDIIGAWAKDRLGNYIWECVPGGDNQRFAAQKLMQNIIMYSLTGTYKSDAIHKPYINEKLKQ